VLLPRRQAKLARGAKNKEHSMSQELDTSIALMRRRSRGRSNCCCDGVGGATIAARRVRSRFPTDRHHQSEGFDMLFGTCSCLPTAISMSRRGWFGLVQCREPVNQLEAMGPMPAGEWLRDVVRVGSLDEPGEPPRGDRAALASQRADREAVPMPSFSELMMPTTPWRVRGAL
jgi:hypothetical protein